MMQNLKPGSFEVLCRRRAVAICGSDPEIIRGDLAGTWPSHYPFIAGHEWFGEVASVGGGVLDFKAGDRVAGEAHKGSGHCRNCLSPKIINLINSGQLAIKDLITHTKPLEDFAQALEIFVNRRDGAIKVVIEPNGAGK